MPRTTAGYVLARQLCRAGTAVGANIEEAEVGQTTAEFIRKMNIAKAEVRETSYWLRLIAETD